MSRIYKIVPRAAWEIAQAAGRFEGAGVDLEDGFIHFSTADQAGETARRHFHGRSDLVVLEVESDGLADLKWEISRGGAAFPHLHAVLRPSSVLAVHAAPLDADGAPQLGDLAR